MVFKKSNSLILFGLLVLSLILVSTGSLAAEEDPLKIGITKLLSHPALNATEQGVIDEVVAAGYERGEDVEFIKKNAQLEKSNAVTIAQNFKSRNVDLVVSIATTTTQATAQVLEDIPIVVAAVTDLVEAGAVDDYDDYDDPSDNGNITGISDQLPNPEQFVEDSFELIKEIDPSVQKVGIVFNPGEPNSSFMTEKAREVSDEMGLELIEATATSSAEVNPAANSLKGRVDAIWVSTDNTVVSALPTVSKVAKEEGVPFLMADPTAISEGPLVGFGFDYYDHGRKAGKIVVDILKGKKPNQIPIHTMKYEDVATTLNLETAQAIGYDFKKSLIKKAGQIYFGGEIWEKR